jgi:hypothetical protein
VLTIVAVELMLEIEEFITTLGTCGQSAGNERSNGNKAALRDIWFGALGVIVCLRLPVHEGSCHIGGNGGCWTVSRASLLTQPYQCS